MPKIIVPGLMFEIVTLPLIVDPQMSTKVLFESMTTLPVITFPGMLLWPTSMPVVSPPWLEMFPFTVTPPRRIRVEPDCCSISPLTVTLERLHTASSGTTMFPKVPDMMGYWLLQTKSSALALGLQVPYKLLALADEVIQ